MNVLSRTKIIALFKSGELKIETPDDYYQTAADLVYSKDNPFQQCSLDLHVGFIYVPESKDDDGSMSQPKIHEHSLCPGGTVLIRTREKIVLPNDVGAICFAPSSKALGGLMITNMGHVDPGYSGNLHFTVINMGKEHNDIRAISDTVCTMILFELSEIVQPYGAEDFVQVQSHQGASGIPSSVHKSLPKLARDFLDVEKRAMEAAKRVFENTKLWQIGVPVIGGVAVALLALFQSYINKPWENEINKANNKVVALEQKVDYEKRIISIEAKLDQLTQKASRK
jgi:dCTP deaminase